MKTEIVLKELKNIRIENYTYDLPDERIAKFPLARREASKLLFIGMARSGSNILQKYVISSSLDKH